MHASRTAGDPMAAANQALNLGVDMLNDHDQFNIIAFDHEQVSFDPAMAIATPDAKAKAHQWIATACQARGLTVCEEGGVALLPPSPPLPLPRRELHFIRGDKKAPHSWGSYSLLG